jgi:hypothetical protein
MTLRDLTENMEIQGNVIVKQWNEEKETYNILVETESAIFTEEVLDMEILYMYAVNNSLIIEVEYQPLLTEK